MSYIMQRYKCKNCGDEFNVSLGTFGGGMPPKCFKCEHPYSQFEKIADEWKMDDGKWFSEITN